MTRYDEKRRLKRKELEARRLRRPKTAPQSNQFRDDAIATKQLVRLRLQRGFVNHGEWCADRWRPPFVERGLRSWESHVLKRIVQLTPAKRRLLVGRTKDRLRAASSKILALDEPYVQFNPLVRGLIRIDLDLIFPGGWHQLRYALEAVPGLPCLPHLVVADVEPATQAVLRPHLYYLLPYDAAVWWDPSDPRCRRDVMKLYSAVAAGIVQALLPLGADPGGLAHINHGKNPLSPWWTTRIWNEAQFPTLGDWAGYVDMAAHRKAIVRSSAASLSGLHLEASNALFTAFQKESIGLLHKWHFAGDVEYRKGLGDRRRLEHKLFRSLIKAAGTFDGNIKQAMAVLYRVVAFVSEHWDPSRLKNTTRDRGVCAEVVTNLSLIERQRVGAYHTHRVMKDRKLSAITAAARHLYEIKEPVTKTAVARISRVSRTTVDKYWAVAVTSVTVVQD